MASNEFENLKKTSDLLRLTYGIVPIVAGADKFTNILTDWTGYIPDSFSGSLPVSPHVLMMVVGVIEIIAGLIVLARPVIGGYIVAAWLVLIGIILIIGGGNFDVAVRDFVMAVGAFSLTRIAKFAKWN